MGASINPSSACKWLCFPGFSEGHAVPGAAASTPDMMEPPLAKLAVKAQLETSLFKSHHGDCALHARLMFSLLDQHWGLNNMGHRAKSPVCLLHCLVLQTLTLKAVKVCQLFWVSSNCRVALHGSNPAPAPAVVWMIPELTCKPGWLWESQFSSENGCKGKNLQCCGESNQKFILWVKLAGHSETETWTWREFDLAHFVHIRNDEAVQTW